MQNRVKADLSLLMIAVIWGSSFPMMKYVLGFLPSFTYLSLRFIIAAVVLIICFRKKVAAADKKALIYGCIIGVLLAGGMALQVSGLYFTTASNSAFITGLNVVFVPVVSVLLLRKKPRGNSIIGVFLALIGLFFLTGGLDFKFNVGDFLTLLCAVCFTFQIISIDRFTQEYDPELLATLQIITAAVIFTGIWRFANPEPAVFNPTVVFILVVTGILGTALAFLVQTIAQKYTSPTHTTLILTAEPVFGALFALVIPDSQGVVESLALYTLVGCLLILGGMVISELSSSH